MQLFMNGDLFYELGNISDDEIINKYAIEYLEHL